MFEKLTGFIQGANIAGASSSKKSITTIAHEVIAGKWGNGDERKKRLKKAGYDYNKVQAKVNQILSNKNKKAKQKYTKKLPSINLKKTRAEVINDTIKWAKWIAKDNTFHYGACNQHSGSPKPKKNADKKMCSHHNGCYFCGTNSRMKSDVIVLKEKTYCCNSFLGAAWAHGGCIPEALSMCQKGNSWDFGTGGGSYHKSPLFANLGKLPKNKLKKGDILCLPSHVKMYIGDGKCIEAGHRDDNIKGSESWKDSIAIHNVGNYDRVYRLKTSVNTKMPIRHGEVGKRVVKWQAFLDGYFDGKVGDADGIFGDNTLKWTKEFQEKEIGKGQGDGIVGERTLAAAKAKK